MSALTVLKEHKSELEEKFQFAPAWMKFESEYSFAIQHLRANDYLAKTADADRAGLLSAMANVAMCGLTLNPAEKQAYLIPRKGKICLDPSYQGLIKLATDTGSIEWVQANVVYANDAFTDNGVGERPSHNHDPFSKDRGEFVGVYCVAKTKGGDYLTTVMSKDEVMAVCLNSESVKKHGIGSDKAGPWHSHFNEMAKKTVIRRAWKTWPRSDEHDHELRLARAVEISNENEGIQFIPTAPRLSDYSDEDKIYFDQMIEQNKALEMYVFSQTKDAGVMGNLYNSFEKGTVTKYKRVVDELLDKGAQQFADYVAMYNPEDDLAVEEIRAEVTDSVFELIKERA